MITLFSPDGKSFYKIKLYMEDRKLMHHKEYRLTSKSPIYNKLNKQLQIYKIPGHIHNIIIYLYEKESDMHSNLLYRGLDSKDRVQYIYGSKYATDRKSNKLIILGRVIKALPAIKKFIDSNIKEHGAYNSVISILLSVALKFFIRMGKRVYELNNNTVGLSTLKNNNFKVTAGGIYIRFNGKDNIEHKFFLESSSFIYNPLKKLIESAKSKTDYVFVYKGVYGDMIRISESKINKLLQSITKDSNIHIKDLRMFGANMIFAEHKLDGRDDKYALEKTADRIGHTPAISKKSYIIDELFKLTTTKKFKTALDLLKYLTNV